MGNPWMATSRKLLLSVSGGRAASASRAASRSTAWPFNRSSLWQLRPLLLGASTVQGQTRNSPSPAAAARWLDRFGGEPLAAALGPCPRRPPRAGKQGGRAAPEAAEGDQRGQTGARPAASAAAARGSRTRPIIDDPGAAGRLKLRQAAGLSTGSSLAAPRQVQFGECLASYCWPVWVEGAEHWANVRFSNMLSGCLGGARQHSQSDHRRSATGQALERYSSCHDALGPLALSVAGDLGSPPAWRLATCAPWESDPARALDRGL